MIISFSKKFIFIKNLKIGGSSLEIYLAQFCSDEDIITPLTKIEENFKREKKIRSIQNTKIKIFSLGLRNLKKFNFYKTKEIHDHAELSQIINSNLKKKIKDFYIFTLVRNPFNQIVSYFFWYLFHEKNFSQNSLNNMDKQYLKKEFKQFLKKKSFNFFKDQEKRCNAKNLSIDIFKFEDYQNCIKTVKEKLKLGKGKFEIGDINFKNLNITNKLTIDQEDAEIILKNGKYFFENFSYSKEIPTKFISS